MPNVNLTDSRKRDAVVKAETTGVAEELRYVDNDGNTAYTRKILKATVAHDYATLVERYGDDQEKLGLALVDGDPEVDMEKCGVYLWGVSKVYVNSEDGIVYRIEQTEIVRDPEGNIKEKRARQRAEANVDMEIPLTWTGRQINKAEAVRKFVFSSKLQIVHINGLTYDFLYGMASELAKSNSLMMIGGGSKGRDPLIFRSGSIPYRGFLEGRIDGDKYILLLHLSNMELKQVGEPAANSVIEESTSKASDQNKSDEKAAGEVAASKKVEKKNAEPKKAANKIEPEPAKSNESDSEPAVKADNKSEVREETGVPDANDKKSKSQKTEKKKKSSAKKATKNLENKKKSETKAPVKKDKVADKQPSAAVPGDLQGPVSSQDLGVWLKSIRMGKYLDMFIENEIDVDVLSELTDDDLKELEVPLGSRRRLLKAVAEADNLRAEVVMAVQTMSGSKSSSKK